MLIELNIPDQRVSEQQMQIIVSFLRQAETVPELFLPPAFAAQRPDYLKIAARANTAPSAVKSTSEIDAYIAQERGAW